MGFEPSRVCPERPLRALEPVRAREQCPEHQEVPDGDRASGVLRPVELALEAQADVRVACGALEEPTALGVPETL